MGRCPLAEFLGWRRWFMVMSELFMYSGIAWEKLNVHSRPSTRETLPEVYTNSSIKETICRLNGMSAVTV